MALASPRALFILPAIFRAIPLNSPCWESFSIAEQKQETSQCVKARNNERTCLSLELRFDLHCSFGSALWFFSNQLGKWVLDKV